MNVIGRLKARNWVDCLEVQECLGIDFKTGLRLFEFKSVREVSWNPAPLNGQRVETFFKLMETDTLEDVLEKIKVLKGGE